MKFTSDQIEALASQLTAIAGIFNPGSAVAIGLLLKAGTQLNALIHDIKTQTEANAPEVWAEVSKDYSDALAAFQLSVAKE